MSLYRLGVQGDASLSTPMDMVRRTSHYDMARRHMEVGAWIATPGWLREQINMLDAEFLAVGKELRDNIGHCLPDQPDADSPQCQELRRFTQNVWTPLKIEWDTFVDNHQKWYENFWGSTWDTIKDYRLKLIAVRRKAQAMGFMFQGPEPAPPAKTPWESLGNIVKWVIALVAGAGIIYVIKLFFDR